MSNQVDEIKCIASATKDSEFDITVYDVLGNHISVDIWYDLDVCFNIFKENADLIKKHCKHTVKKAKNKYSFNTPDLKSFRIKKEYGGGKSIEYTLSKYDDMLHIVTSDPNDKNLCYTMSESGDVTLYFVVLKFN